MKLTPEYTIIRAQEEPVRPSEEELHALYNDYHPIKVSHALGLVLDE